MENAGFEPAKKMGQMAQLAKEKRHPQCAWHSQQHQWNLYHLLSARGLTLSWVRTMSGRRHAKTNLMLLSSSALMTAAILPGALTLITFLPLLRMDSSTLPTSGVMEAA
jgi:hypothetical protein